MKVIDILNKKKFVFSLEIFPPSKKKSLDSIFPIIEQLKLLNPDFISVTYGAGGSTRDRTVEIADKIENFFKIPAVAHLTCVGATKDSISKILDELKSKGIKNIMALRGDLPENDLQPLKDFRYASDLVYFIKNGWDFCVGVAGYPEKHPQSISFDTDIKYLKEKVDAGADFITTQLFLDNRHFYKFRDNITKIGIKVPLIAGVMTATAISNLEKMATLCKVEIPEKFKLSVISSCSKNSEVCEETIKYTSEQINDLIKNGVKAIHLYAMNKVEQNKRIYYESKLSEIRKVL